MKKKRLVLNALSLWVFALLTACSSSGDLTTTSSSEKKQTSVKTSKAGSISSSLNTKNEASKKVISKQSDFSHSHPSNPCTAAVEHSHQYQDEKHQHRYDCENTNEFVSNAHVHKATAKTRRFRHVHPNGANKHSHHR